MKSARVTFKNGDIITTNINGTDKEIKEYYGIGKIFNFGIDGDKLIAVSECEILKECYFN